MKLFQTIQILHIWKSLNIKPYGYTEIHQQDIEKCKRTFIVFEFRNNSYEKMKER